MITTVIDCGTFKTVMEINSSLNRHGRHNDDNTPRHQAHFSFQHRYRLTLFKWHELESIDNCFVHDANMFARQGMGQGSRTLAPRQDMAVCAESAHWMSDHCHCD